MIIVAPEMEALITIQWTTLRPWVHYTLKLNSTLSPNVTAGSLLCHCCCITRIHLNPNNSTQQWLHKRSAVSKASDISNLDVIYKWILSNISNMIKQMQASKDLSVQYQY